MLFNTLTPNIEADTTVCGSITLFELSVFGLTGPLDSNNVASS